MAERRFARPLDRSFQGRGELRLVEASHENARCGCLSFERLRGRSSREEKRNQQRCPHRDDPYPLRAAHRLATIAKERLGTQTATASYGLCPPYKSTIRCLCQGECASHRTFSHSNAPMARCRHTNPRSAAAVRQLSMAELLGRMLGSQHSPTGTDITHSRQFPSNGCCTNRQSAAFTQEKRHQAASPLATDIVQIHNPLPEVRHRKPKRLRFDHLDRAAVSEKRCTGMLQVIEGHLDFDPRRT